MRIVIERVGKCKQCGKCCPPICPHLKDNLCLIHDKKDQWCDLCTTNHEICAKSPTMPSRHWRPDCGYRFIVVSKPLEITGFAYPGEITGCHSVFNDELIKKE
jgi:hypothetical protein